MERDEFCSTFLKIIFDEFCVNVLKYGDLKREIRLYLSERQHRFGHFFCKSFYALKSGIWYADWHEFVKAQNSNSS